MAGGDLHCECYTYGLLVLSEEIVLETDGERESTLRKLYLRAVSSA